jgi:hypothetical protein
MQTLVQAKPRIFNLNKCSIDLSQVIGQPFNTNFEVVDRHTGKLQVVTDPRLILTKSFLEEFKVDEDDVAEGKDNREIGLESEVSAQKLRHDEIETMKATTSGSAEII